MRFAKLMWNFIARTHAQQCAPDGESLPQSADGRQWIWISYAPEFWLMLAAFVGPRTSHSALTLISMTAAVVTGVPCFFSDGFSCYLAALVAVYSIIRSQSLRVLASADAPANL